jgi:hypothetical protein
LCSLNYPALKAVSQRKSYALRNIAQIAILSE